MSRVEDNDIRRVLRMEEMFIRAKLMIDHVEDVDELDEEVCWEFFGNLRNILKARNGRRIMNDLSVENFLMD